MEPHFHADSYGYRPGRSALDAVAVCRERCLRQDWVLDLDIQAFFDRVPWDLILKAVAHHTDQRWILIYVERWLKAPLQHEDGSLVERERGTPQGSAISPLLANMFLHYAFDAWMAGSSRPSGLSATATTSSSTPQANAKPACCGPRSPGAWRSVGLQLNEQKTRIVYCKDSIAPAPTSTTLHVLGVHVPPPAGAEQARRDSSSASSQQSATTSKSASGERSAAGACTVARATPSGPRRRRSTRSPGLDQLLRALLPLAVGQAPQNGSTTTWFAGPLEIQAAAPPPRQSTQVPGHRLPTRARPIRALAVRRAP